MNIAKLPSTDALDFALDASALDLDLDGSLALAMDLDVHAVKRTPHQLPNKSPQT